MLKSLKLITVIVWVDSILTAEVESSSKCNQISFNLKAFGYLANRNKVMFTAKGKSRGDAINHCSKFCFGYRRCIGMEICKISDRILPLSRLLSANDKKRRTVINKE